MPDRRARMLLLVLLSCGQSPREGGLVTAIPAEETGAGPFNASARVVAPPADADGDGEDARTDCDDDDPAVNNDAEEDCANGRDDDCDGRLDCEDGTCAGAPVCEEVCGGGLDEDADGLVDCSDDDCIDACVPVWARVLGGNARIVERGSATRYDPGASTHCPVERRGYELTVTSAHGRAWTGASPASGLSWTWAVGWMRADALELKQDWGMSCGSSATRTYAWPLARSGVLVRGLPATATSFLPGILDVSRRGALAVSKWWPATGYSPDAWLVFTGGTSWYRGTFVPGPKGTAISTWSSTAGWLTEYHTRWTRSWLGPLRSGSTVSLRMLPSAIPTGAR